MKLTWPQLMRQKKHPNWVNTPQGAKPVDPRSARTMRRGTARMKANRGSEKLNRLIRSAFVSVIELMVVILAASWIGSFIWHQYEGASTGRAVVQGIVATTAVMVWLVFTRERVKHDTHVAQQHERDLQLGADQPQPDDRTARLGRVGPAGPTKVTDIRTNFEREFDQQPGWDEPV